MSHEGVDRMVRVAQGRLEECRRRLAAAESEIASVERLLRQTCGQRQLLLSGQTGLAPLAVAECTRVLDRRETCLVDGLAQAAVRRDEARERVRQALTEKKSLERLRDIRLQAARREEASQQEHAGAEVARSVKWLRDALAASGDEVRA